MFLTIAISLVNRIIPSPPEETGHSFGGGR